MAKFYLTCFILLILRGAVWAQKLKTIGSKATIVIPENIPKSYDTKPGWKLLWHDEFDGDSLDFNNFWPQWQETPNTLTYFTPRRENVLLEKGYLSVINQKETFKGYPYTGAHIVSARKIGLNSRIEVSMKIPKGKGLWPCLWLFAYDLGDSLYQEIDIAEYRGSKPAEFDISNHYRDKKANQNNTIWRRIKTRSTKGGKLDLSEDYHVYTCEWTKGSLRFFIDDILMFETFEQIPQHPMPLILSMGVGGIDGNPTKKTPFPAVLSFDYVRVYTKTTEP
jgi:beta-glucanase (GH16 family)